jgi:hypothetical protein
LGGVGVVGVAGVSVEPSGDPLVFHAGRGEWYNQPHNERWDMGEDVADIPPANWHVELKNVLAAQSLSRTLVVVDVSEMDWLVGQDGGFLYRLSKRLSEQGIRLAVVGTERVVDAMRLLGLDEVLQLCSSLNDVE